MFGYYLDLAVRSFKRNKVLTALMVLAVAMGIGATMTTLTVLHVLSGDPLPGRSAHLFYPQIDPRDMVGYHKGVEPPGQMTLIDGLNLLHAGRADRQALMTGGTIPVQPDNTEIDPFYTHARFTTAGFFPMFGVTFLHGSGWSAADDANRARVAVISSKLDDKLFGGKNAVGHTLRLNGVEFRIIGVIGDWHPDPHFYDLYAGTYAYAEQVFLPLRTALDIQASHDGSVDCWANGAGGIGGTRPSDTCTWLQFWVQLDTPAKVAAYRQFLVHYSQQQAQLGRFQRPPNVRLRDLMQWLDYNQIVPSDTRLQAWLALGFLLVCLINTVGLMLAKFMRRSAELGILRALGASRFAVFEQLLIEAGVVGFAGGLGGMLLAVLGLWLVRRQPADYASLAHLDPFMLLLTTALAVGATLLAGLFPAWRACQIAPALQIKAS